MKKLIVGLTMVVVAVVLVSVGTRASEAGKKRTIRVQEHGTNATYVPVQTLVGGSGPSSQGDYLAFDDPVFDPDTEAQVGHVMGVCVLVDVSVQTFMCPDVTLILTGKGQIAVGGMFDGTGKPASGPILAGTGMFSGAVGTYTITALDGGTIDDWVVTLSQ